MAIDAKSLKVGELREELAKRGKPTDGLKADLIIRLQEALDEEEFGLTSTDAPAAAAAPVVEAAPVAAVPVPVVPEPAAKAAPEPTPVAEPTPAAVAEPIEMTAEEKAMEEKRRARAERFGIPFVSSSEIAARYAPPAPPQQQKKQNNNNNQKGNNSNQQSQNKNKNKNKNKGNDNQKPDVAALMGVTDEKKRKREERFQAPEDKELAEKLARRKAKFNL